MVKLRQINTGALLIPDPVRKAEHRRVHFKIPKHITRAIEKSMMRQEYGLRGKTKWMIEALEQFIDVKKNPYRKQQIIECAGIRDKTSAHSLLIPNGVWVKAWREGLDAAIFGAETDPPDYIDPSVPIVVMAAIINRLVRENVSVD